MALFREMGRIPGGRVDETGRFGRHLAPPMNPIFKGVWSAAPVDASDAEIDEQIAFFGDHGAPFFFWWTRGEPTALGERLQAHGLEPWDLNAPILEARLDEMDFAAAGADRLPAGFVIERARDATDVADFAQVFRDAYNLPPWAPQAWIDATLALGVERAPWTIYVGRLDGAPVASCFGFNGGEVASVYAVGTLPGMRGRGLGAAITLAPYADARAAGHTHAVLFATEAGLPVYERLGMRKTGGAISRFLYKAG